MHTLSGRVFELLGDFTPGVSDIAVGLSRIPRWAGATVRSWSVLQHSLAALSIAGSNPVVQVAALFHDSEEMATGDIPGPFKTDSQRELALKIRKQIYQKTLGLPYPSGGILETLAEIDTRLLLAEVHCLAHPRIRQDFEGTWDDEAVDAVWSLIDLTPNEAITLFIRVANDLLETREVRSLAGRA